MSAVTRIAVCEDSRTYARALVRFIELAHDLRVVEVFSTAEEMIAALPRLRPDLVTMDLELPGLDGLEAIERILSNHRQPLVVISAHSRRGSERAAAALAAGALDAIGKSELRLDAAEAPPAVALRRRLRRLAHMQIPVLNPPPRPPVPSRPRPRSSPALAVGIGASTGGPAALATVLSMLPSDYPLPVLVTQHMSPGFTSGLVTWLNEAVPPPVRLAEHRVLARPGVWFAPDDNHLTLGPGMMLSLDSVTVAGLHRPSADVLLTSLARSVGKGAVAVVLTGMGRDGAAGVAAVHAAGGVAIAQDASSCVVNGMPRAALESGADRSLSPPEIGLALRVLAKAAAPR